MHLFLDPRVYQLLGASAVGARQGLSGAEQPADQRSLFVHRAALWPEVNAVEFVERSLLFGSRLAWQARHFFRRCGDRPTAVVAARHAFERRNLPPQIADFLTVATH